MAQPSQEQPRPGTKNQPRRLPGRQLLRRTAGRREGHQGGFHPPRRELPIYPQPGRPAQTPRTQWSQGSKICSQGARTNSLCFGGALSRSFWARVQERAPSLRPHCRGRSPLGRAPVWQAIIPNECKRLAEVDFPIAVVSKDCAREKSIRHGHPSKLHLWWARRPLGACRSRSSWGQPLLPV